MIDFFKELIWAIIHDEETKIMLSIAMSFMALGISVALMLAKATGR